MNRYGVFYSRKLAGWGPNIRRTQDYQFNSKRKLQQHRPFLPTSFLLFYLCSLSLQTVSYFKGTSDLCFSSLWSTSSRKECIEIQYCSAFTENAYMKSITAGVINTTFPRRLHSAIQPHTFDWSSVIFTVWFSRISTREFLIYAQPP